MLSGALEDGLRREWVYGGDLLVFKDVPPLKGFCAFADVQIREVFGTPDPVRAQFELDRDEYLSRVEALQRRFRKDTNAKGAGLGEEGVIDGGQGDERPAVVEEWLRVAEEAERRGLALRLLGGVAVRVRARDGLHPAFGREYADLDCKVPWGRSAEAGWLLESFGYTPHVRFNAIDGRERLLFFQGSYGGKV